MIQLPPIEPVRPLPKIEFFPGLWGPVFDEDEHLDTSSAVINQASAAERRGVAPNKAAHSHSVTVWVVLLPEPWASVVPVFDEDENLGSHEPGAHGGVATRTSRAEAR